jgi:hypothetical protein
MAFTSSAVATGRSPARQRTTKPFMSVFLAVVRATTTSPSDFQSPLRSSNAWTKRAFASKTGDSTNLFAAMSNKENCVAAVTSRRSTSMSRTKPFSLKAASFIKRASRNPRQELPELPCSVHHLLPGVVVRARRGGGQEGRHVSEQKADDSGFHVVESALAKHSLVTNRPGLLRRQALGMSKLSPARPGRSGPDLRCSRR